MQQTHTTGRMMQSFFPAIPGYTCFFLISLMDSSAQSNNSIDQKYIYIIRPPCPECFVQILP